MEEGTFLTRLKRGQWTGEEWGKVEEGQNERLIEGGEMSYSI